jgi:hypothetical protein
VGIQSPEELLEVLLALLPEAALVGIAVVERVVDEEE